MDLAPLNRFLLETPMNSKQQSAKMAKELSQVRQKKIKQLKTKINSGAYQISNLDLAKAMFLSQ